jgi:membrane protein DedA with SNARE-associated domain
VRTAFLGIFGIDIEEFFKSLSPYGEVVLWLIIFAETGLLIGFFLPGDSLLFTAGLLAEQGKLNLAAVRIWVCRKCRRSMWCATTCVCRS